MSLLDDDEGVGIDAGHQFLQLCQLLPLHRCQDNFGILMAICALAVEQRCTTLQLLADLESNLLIFSRSDKNQKLTTVVNNSKQPITARFDMSCRELISEKCGKIFEIPPFTAVIFKVTGDNTLTIN